MKAVRFVIPKTGTDSFRIQVDRGARFYDTIHFHPEHQLMLILKGEGTGFIGNHVERFGPGDLILTGRNVPHVTKCDEGYYSDNSGLEVHSLTIFFNEDAFGQRFFGIPEMAHIKRMLEKAAMGIKVEGQDRDRIAKIMMVIRRKQGFERFLDLLSILNIIALSESVRTLSTIPFTAPSKDAENERINIVFNYLSSNFKQAVSLDDISTIASMTPNAFCRYFKHRTGKAYTEFLNDMRIEHACKLIAGSKETFSDIAFGSGFNSISYFNRQFKKITGRTPMEYRRELGVSRFPSKELILLVPDIR